MRPFSACLRQAQRFCWLLMVLVCCLSVPALAAPSPPGQDPTTGMTFVFVPGGCFKMGALQYYAPRSHESPAHEVCVSDFWLGTFEVTQQQWQTVMGSNPSQFPGCGPACPVETVSWLDVQSFIENLNAQSGKQYRLPTEAEWEYAASSGGTELLAGYIKNKHVNDGSRPMEDVLAWYSGNSGQTPHPVGTKAPNGLGLYDLAGNVWEWVGDRYGYSDEYHGDKNYYAKSPKRNPAGPASGTFRVYRGGSWYDEPEELRTSRRDFLFPAQRGSFLGFRLALPATGR